LAVEPTDRHNRGRTHICCAPKHYLPAGCEQEWVKSQLQWGHINRDSESILVPN